MPAKKPDLDKLVRATLDSLSGLVFDDDARIVELVVRKEYANPGDEGATIEVEEWHAAAVDVIDKSAVERTLRLLP